MTGCTSITKAAEAMAGPASALGAVVDTAADWIENTDPLVRRQKEATYLAELESYRSAFS